MFAGHHRLYLEWRIEPNW